MRIALVWFPGFERTGTSRNDQCDTPCSRVLLEKLTGFQLVNKLPTFNPYPTAFPYGNGMVLHFYQQQESSTTKTVHKVINKGLKAYV